MANYKAIPQGYMTVGEVAKKMGVTVRALQYYDREGLFCPSAVSEGGRRLYTDKDIIKLHQILSLKSLGFSIDEIKNRLTSIDTPDEVAAALTEQSKAIQAQIETLTQSLRDIETLKTEVLKMQSVDFKKYADIIVNLQMRNDNYWLIKYFDDNTLDYLRGRFDKELSFAAECASSGLEAESERFNREQQKVREQLERERRERDEKAGKTGGQPDGNDGEGNEASSNGYGKGD